MKYISVAIDGPSGAGKSTVARAAAAQLGYVYVDTGAMYRTIGLAVCRRGISGEDTEGIRSVLPDIRVGITYENGAQHVLLNGEDVSSEIRTPEIAYYASRVSAVPEVREFLLNTQRDMAKNGNILMDGRDIGTVPTRRSRSFSPHRLSRAQSAAIRSLPRRDSRSRWRACCTTSTSATVRT